MMAPQNVLLLQRMRRDGDARRWRTVLRVPPGQIGAAMQLVRLADAIDGALRWRLAPPEPGGSVLLWSDGRWVDGT